MFVACAFLRRLDEGLVNGRSGEGPEPRAESGIDSDRRSNGGSSSGSLHSAR